MKRPITVIVAVLLSLSLCGCGTEHSLGNSSDNLSDYYSNTAQTFEISSSEDSVIPESSSEESSGIDNSPEETAFESSYEAVANMRIGWNVGNSLDSAGNLSGTQASAFETAWGNPVTTPELIKAIKDAGFGAVRVPVTWYCNMDENGNVNAFWLDRVEEVVNYVLDEGMYAIINVHHDTGGSETAWLRADPTMYETMSGRYEYLWKQIAERFADYDEKLLFESFNEILDSNFNWNGSGAEEYGTVNRLNQLFVDTIRSTGGRNAVRNIIVNSYGASTAQSQIDGFKVPDDPAEDRLIAEMHCYDPWAFTSRGGDTTWDETDKAVLESIIERVNRQVINEQGIPVIIGEFGAQDADNPEERAAYVADFIGIAEKYGITCFWWDDGGSLKIIDRRSYEITEPEILEAMMNALKEG